MKLPSISVVIPTLNSERTLQECLSNIVNQDYPKEKIETIIIDAGSTDGTLKIARQFQVNRILTNPLKTGEAGKSVGAKAAKNDIIALVDSDNLLEGKDWLRRMVEPFNDAEIIASEPLYYTYRRKDPLVVRYSALIGANDPICMYIGNYDRYNYLTGKWTELAIKTEDKDSYLKIQLEEDNIPTIGANGFLIRREALLKTTYQPYLFDIDIVWELVQKGYNKFAKVKIGIVHLFADSVKVFVKKQQRRIRDYLYYQKYKMRHYPWGEIPHRKIWRFVACTIFIFPLFLDAFRGYCKIRDRAWFFHIIACWLTLLIYGTRYAPRGIRYLWLGRLERIRRKVKKE